jgi:Domain of unknown function (DUF4252)
MTKSHLSKITLFGVLFVLLTSFSFSPHPINDFYKQHKNDQDMEAKVVPPKMAAMFVDEDYPEAIDLLKSMTALKYLNFYGDKAKISEYAKNAISAKGSYNKLLDVIEGSREVVVFGEKKRGEVRKIIAVVQTKTQFLLIIGKGKLSKRQIEGLPALSKEIQ